MPNPKETHETVQMPEEDGTMAGDSPLDAEPSRRAPPRKPARGKRAVIERRYEEVVPSGAVAAPENPADEEPSEFESESPLDAEAEAALHMVEVDRIGPGEGMGWVQRGFDFGDGHGTQQIGYGRVGSFPDDQGIYERVQALAGGGQYRFIRRGKKPVAKILSGPPLPLPTEQAGSVGGYPNGAYPNARGGFDRMGFEEPLFERAGPRDPFEDPNFDPSVGIDPEAFSQNALNGWYRGGPYNKLVFYVNGVPSRPPRGARPPASLISGQAASFDAYVPPTAPSDVEGAKPFSLSEWLQMQSEERRQKESEERERRDREREERREEENKRREEERQKREDEREERRQEETRRREEEARRREDENRRREDERRREEREEERRREDRKEAARIAAETTKVQAEAMKEAAKVAAEATKESAKAQAESNSRLFEVLLKKSDSGSTKEVLDLGLRIAEVAQGGKEQSAATEIAEAIQTAAPAVAQAARDTVLGIKGYPIPGQPWGQGQQPQGAPQIQGQPAPQQITGPPANQAGSTGSVPDANETSANMQLVTYLVKQWTLGAKPTVAQLRDGVVAYGLDANYKNILQRITLATPEIVVSEFEKGTQALGNPPQFANSLPAVRAMSTDQGGRAWFQGLKDAIRRGDHSAPQAPPPNQAPAPTPVPAPPSPTPAQPQGGTTMAGQQPPAAGSGGTTLS